MKPSLSILALLSLGIACNDGYSPSRGHNTSSKGHEEFRLRMAQGAGVFRPESIKTSASLGLAGEEIATIKIDEHSGAWSWAGFDTTRGEPIPAHTDLVQVARSFISEHERELGFRPDEILIQEGGIQSPYPKIRMITLKRQHLGTEVKGAFIQLFFALQADGSLRLSELVNNSYGAIRISEGTKSLLADSEAISASGVDDFKIDEKRTVITPTLKDGLYSFSYATEFKLEDKETSEQITLTLDNAKKEIAEAYSNHVYAYKHIHAETYGTSYVLKDIITRPLKFLRILDSGTEKTTDELGKIDLSAPTVKMVLHNTYNNSKVFSASDLENPISFDINLGPQDQAVLKLGTGHAAGLNVYSTVARTTEYAAKYLSEAEFKLFRKGINSIVNINDSCNAIYNGSLNFYKQSDSCANTGLISDTIMHEWGHALDDYLGPTSKAHSDSQSGMFDTAYSEGIGDVLAAYISRSPYRGQGARLNDPKPRRSLKNDRTYPPANQEEAGSHSLGLVIGGAFWDMHENLASLYGMDKGNDTAARLFFRHLITSDRYLDAYQAVLRVDDDDNNPTTKSPHYCSINRAFARHNLSGGEKAESDCLDTDQSIAVKILEDRGDGQLSLILSAGGAKRIVGCPGRVNACTENAMGLVGFTASEGDDISTVKGSRKFYQGKGVVDAKTNPVYTFFSVNDQNVMIAKRILEFKTGSAPVPEPQVKP